MTALYDLFLKQKGRENHFLADVEAVHRASGALTTFYFGTKGLITDTKRYRPWLADDGFDFASSTVVPGTLSFLPPKLPDELRLNQLPSGQLDTLLDYDFEGAKITLRHGGFSFATGHLAYSDYQVFRVCEAETIVVGLEVAKLPLRSREARLRFPVEERLLGGFGYCFDANGSSNHFGFGAPAKLDLRDDLSLSCWINPYGSAQKGQILGWATSPFKLNRNTDGKLEWSWVKGGTPVAKTTAFQTLDECKYDLRIRHVDDAVIFLIYDYCNARLVREVFSGSGFNNRDAPSGGQAYRFFNNWGADTQRYNGDLWEVVLRDVADDEDELVRRRWRPLTAAEKLDSNLKHYVPLNQTGGTTASDLSPSPADGTLSGPERWFPTLTADAENQGQQVKNVLGHVEAIVPLKVHEDPPIWMVHSSGEFSFEDSGFYEGGAGRDHGDSYTSLRDFRQATTEITTWDDLKCPVGSFVRTNDDPVKPPRVKGHGLDLVGDGSFFVLNDPVSIALYLATRRGPEPFDFDTEVDLPGWEEARDYCWNDLPQGGLTGIEVNDGEQIEAAMQRLLRGISAYPRVNRIDGKLALRRLTGVAGMGGDPKAAFERSIITDGTLQERQVEPPVRAIRIAYGYNGAPMHSDEIVEDVRNLPRGRFLLDPFRYHLVPSDVTGRRNKRALVWELETYFVQLEDVIVEGERQLALLKKTGQGFEFDADLVAVDLDVLDTFLLHIQTGDPNLGEVSSRLKTSSVSEFIALYVGGSLRDNSMKVIGWREDVDAG